VYRVAGVCRSWCVRQFADDRKFAGSSWDERGCCAVVAVGAASPLLTAIDHDETPRSTSASWMHCRSHRTWFVRTKIKHFHCK